MADLYAWDIGSLLNITSNSTEREISLQYHTLAKQYHPDKTDNDPELTERFCQIQQAYQFIKDPQTRREYWQRWPTNPANPSYSPPRPSQPSVFAVPGFVPGFAHMAQPQMFPGFAPFPPMFVGADMAAGFQQMHHNMMHHHAMMMNSMFATPMHPHPFPDIHAGFSPGAFSQTTHTQHGMSSFSSFQQVNVSVASGQSHVQVVVNGVPVTVTSTTQGPPRTVHANPAPTATFHSSSSTSQSAMPSNPPPQQRPTASATTSPSTPPSSAPRSTININNARFQYDPFASATAPTPAPPLRQPQSPVPPSTIDLTSPHRRHHHHHHHHHHIHPSQQPSQPTRTSPNRVEIDLSEDSPRLDPLPKRDSSSSGHRSGHLRSTTTNNHGVQPHPQTAPAPSSSRQRDRDYHSASQQAHTGSQPPSRQGRHTQRPMAQSTATPVQANILDPLDFSLSPADRIRKYHQTHPM